MWNLLRVIKDMAFSDPNKGEPDRNPPPDEYERRDGGHRGGMTQEQFLSELEKLTEIK